MHIPAGFRSLPGALGLVIDYDPRQPLSYGRGETAMPEGLILSLAGGVGATVIVSVSMVGGAVTTRTITVGPQAIWMSTVGWSHCSVEVVAIGDVATSVATALTRERPPHLSDLYLVETLDSSGVAVPVPAGALRLAVSSVPAGFLWRTQATPGPTLDIPAGFPAVGQYADVMGAQYVSAVAGVVGCWLLEAI